MRARLASMLIRCSCPLLAGALAPLGFSPFGLWPLTLLSCALILAWLHQERFPQRTLKQVALSGWCYGIGYFGVGTSWVYVSIHQFGAASVPLASLLTAGFVLGLALFFAIQLAFYRLLVPRNAGSLAILFGFASAWVLGEWFRSWFLTGFPWIYIGYAPLETFLAGWAPITGIYGLSFFTALTAAAGYLLYRSLTHRTVDRRTLDRQTLAQRILSQKTSLQQQNTAKVTGWILIPALLPWLVGYELQTLQWTEARPDTRIRVTLLQGNIDQNRKWQPAYRQRIMQFYSSNTLRHLDSDLIIWPETAITRFYQDARDDLQPLTELLTARGIGLISGVPSSEGSAEQGNLRYFNSVAGLASAEGLYHKQRLVPFGEYVPLESTLRGLIAFFDLPMSSFSLGPADQAPLQFNRRQAGQHKARQLTLAPYICYEIVYPDLVAESRADILLTLSNDSWFGDSIAPHQHLQMARMRALENGRYLVRATNNGISAVVAPNGRVLKQTPQFVEASLTADISAYRGRTPFNRYGSGPVLFILAAIAALLLARRYQPARMTAGR